MYKCTECGSEYDIKPDYCDCGNDEFVLTVRETEIKQVEQGFSEKEQPTEKPGATEKESYTMPKAEPKYSAPSVHPAALAVFILCIICSLLIIFVWHPVKPSAETVNDVVDQIEAKQIPAIDKLWKESPKQETPSVKPAEKIQAVPQKVKTVAQNVQKKVVTRSTKPTDKKNTSSPKQTVQTTPIQTQAVNDSAQKAKEAKQKAEAEALAAAEKARKMALAKQELANYKINLRNSIGQKIDFTRVIGDGDCVISFKLDSTGKLINRNFAKQSENITLNNEVYKAVMSVPSYNPPPLGYKGEILKLNIRFTNGNFAITLE